MERMQKDSAGNKKGKTKQNKTFEMDDRPPPPPKLFETGERQKAAKAGLEF